MTHKTSTSTTILKTLQNFNNHSVHLHEALNISICLRYGCLLYSSNLDVCISEDLDRKQVAQSNWVIQASLMKVVFKRVNGENYQGMMQCPGLARAVGFLLLGLNEQEKESITRTQTVRVARWGLPNWVWPSIRDTLHSLWLGGERIKIVYSLTSLISDFSSADAPHLRSNPLGNRRAKVKSLQMLAFGDTEQN